MIESIAKIHTKPGNNNNKKHYMSVQLITAIRKMLPWLNIGIDHDTVCAGVVGTAIRNSTSCAGRRAAALAGTTSAVPDCSTNHDSADRISGQFLFYHDHNLQKGKLAFSTSCTAVRPHRRLRNDA